MCFLVCLRQHEAVEKCCKLFISVEREDMRDILIRPHDDQAPCLPIDVAHCKDVVATFSVDAEYLVVIVKPETALLGRV